MIMNGKSGNEELKKLIIRIHQYTEQVSQFQKQIKRIEQLINLKTLDLSLPASKKQINSQYKKQPIAVSTINEKELVTTLEKNHKEENMAGPSSGIRYANNFHDVQVYLLTQQQKNDCASENNDESMQLC